MSLDISSTVGKNRTIVICISIRNIKDVPTQIETFDKLKDRNNIGVSI